MGRGFFFKYVLTLSAYDGGEQNKQNAFGKQKATAIVFGPDLANHSLSKSGRRLGVRRHAPLSHSHSHALSLSLTLTLSLAIVEDIFSHNPSLTCTSSLCHRVVCTVQCVGQFMGGTGSNSNPPRHSAVGSRLGRLPQGHCAGLDPSKRSPMQ